VNVCFCTIANSVLGIEIDRIVNLETGFVLFPSSAVLILNDETQYGPTFSWSDGEADICWYTSEAKPGDYLAQLKLIGLIEKNYEWALIH